MQLPPENVGLKIRSNTSVCQNVTIGGKLIDGNYCYPIIGSNIMIGAGSVIIDAVVVGTIVR